MRVVLTSGARATIELTFDELVLVYGSLVEATEALSPSEFRARTGRSRGDADTLAAALKPIVVAMHDTSTGDVALDPDDT